MGHHCCSKQRVKRGLWSPEEDDKLVKHITSHGHGCWSSVPKLAGLQRCGKSCRLRWINYLRPDLRRGSFTEEEERVIIDVHRILGNRWAQIAKHLPGRTDNEVKNFWNSCIKKKLIAQGLDPNTHNLLSSHHHHTTAANATKISRNHHHHHQTNTPVFSITSDSNDDTHQMDIKRPFITIPPPPPSINPTSLYDNSCATTNTAFEFQNPSFGQMVGNQSEVCGNLPSSSSSGFGILDEISCMWDSGLEAMQQQQQLLEEKGHCEGEVVNDKVKAMGNGNQDIDASFINSSSFNFHEFDETSLISCGMYCNVNPMDQLAWDC